MYMLIHSYFREDKRRGGGGMNLKHWRILFRCSRQDIRTKVYSSMYLTEHDKIPFSIPRSKNTESISKGDVLQYYETFAKSVLQK